MIDNQTQKELIPGGTLRTGFPPRRKKAINFIIRSRFPQLMTIITRAATKML